MRRDPLVGSVFDALEDGGLVLDKARELMRRVNVAASVFCDSYRPVVVSGGAIRIGDDGTRRGIAVSEGHTFTTRSEAPVALPAGEVRGVMALAGTDPRVAEVLQHLHIGDWRSLSNAYEAVRNDLGSTPKSGGAEIDRRWPALGADFRRFRNTVNSPDVIGIEARHASSSDHKAPSDRMSRAEAKEWVTTLVRKWLRTRLTDVP